MGTRRALVIPGPGSISLQDVAGAEPGPGEVAIRPVHVGICGTDLELLAGDVDPAYVRYPLVPGHEWSGVVEAVGPGVTGLAPGQNVIAEGVIPCGHCVHCARGETNLCETYDELGFTRPGASFAYTSAAWAEVAGLLSSGKIRLAPLITHRFPLHRFEDAYRALRESDGPRGKVMLDVAPD